VPIDGDANVIGLDGVWFPTRLGDLVLGGGHDGSVAFEDTPLALVVLVDTTEFLDVGVTLSLEGGPVQHWLAAALKFVPDGMTRLVGEIGSVLYYLLGNTSWNKRK
jgi:hypothetical protein